MPNDVLESVLGYAWRYRRAGKVREAFRLERLVFRERRRRRSKGYRPLSAALFVVRNDRPQGQREIFNGG